MPALRDRGVDASRLARGMVERIAAEVGRPGVGLSDGALRFIQAHAWPGNIRQLRNVLERALLLSERTTLEAEDLGELATASPAPRAESAAPLTLLDAECRHIESVLRAERGNVLRAAQVLDISRSALYEKIKKHSLSFSKS
jgi:DNA-binding NtrC family response regulator